MDQKLLLDEALAFLQLTESSHLNDLKTNYHHLAKKFHPDTGEYDSDVLFQELQKQYEFLKEWWNLKGNFFYPNQNPKKSTESVSKATQLKKEGNDPIFNQYKYAKELETKAILIYFEKNKNAPLNLDEAKNKHIEELRHALEPVAKIYNEILVNFPQSIWAQDSKDSLHRLSVWWKK